MKSDPGLECVSSLGKWALVTQKPPHPTRPAQLWSSQPPEKQNKTKPASGTKAEGSCSHGPCYQWGWVTCQPRWVLCPGSLLGNTEGILVSWPRKGEDTHWPLTGFHKMTGLGFVFVSDQPRHRLDQPWHTQVYSSNWENLRAEVQGPVTSFPRENAILLVSTTLFLILEKAGPLVIWLWG